jgi:catechol 2,3-dioxygenase-like lactoylglutathione lyase family enzyme
MRSVASRPCCTGMTQLRSCKRSGSVVIRWLTTIRRPVERWMGPGADKNGRLHGKPREAAMTLAVQALDHLVVQVSDLEVSARWYQRVLGMTRGRIPCGRSSAADRDEIRPPEDQPPPDRHEQGELVHRRPRGARQRDVCFLTDSTPDEVVRHVQAQGVAIVAGPGPRRGAQGTLMSVYCRDPDGALIEIASYIEG